MAHETETTGMTPEARAALAAYIDGRVERAKAELPGPTPTADPRRLKRERDDARRGLAAAQDTITDLERRLEGKDAVIDRMFRAQQSQGGRRGNRGGTGRPKEESR